MDFETINSCRVKFVVPLHRLTTIVMPLATLEIGCSLELIALILLVPSQA